MTKHLTTVILAALCMMALLLAPALAGADTLDPSTLNVTLTYDNNPLEGIEVSICQVADAVVDAQGNVTFTATPAFTEAGADFSLLTDEANIEQAARLDAYASANPNITRDQTTTGSDGVASFEELPAGLYLVAQANSANSDYKVAPYLAMVPTADPIRKGVWSYNVVSEPKISPTHTQRALISVSVYKIWRNTDSHPASVSVQLYQNAQPYGAPVTLSDANYWSYTWGSLNSDDTWTVDEVAVPAGYVKTVSGAVSTGFVITNTKSPNKPAPPASSTSGKTPKTGDSSPLSDWVASGVLCLFGFITLFYVWRSRRKPTSTLAGSHT